MNIKMSETGEPDMSDQLKSFVSSEVKQAVLDSETNLLSSMQTMMDTNFNTFKTSMESTQKELSTMQLAKMEENLFDSYKFKRHGNEAQFRGNIKIISKLREADSSLANANTRVSRSFPFRILERARYLRYALDAAVNNRCNSTVHIRFLAYLTGRNRVNAINFQI